MKGQYTRTALRKAYHTARQLEKAGRIPSTVTFQGVTYKMTPAGFHRLVIALKHSHRFGEAYDVPMLGDTSIKECCQYGYL